MEKDRSDTGGRFGPMSTVSRGWPPDKNKADIVFFERYLAAVLPHLIFLPSRSEAADRCKTKESLYSSAPAVMSWKWLIYSQVWERLKGITAAFSKFTAF